MNADGAGFRVPPKQEPYEQAYVLGFDRLVALDPTSERMSKLGAAREGGRILLPVLNRQVIVDLENRGILVEGRGAARRHWSLLVLHYLLAEETPEDDEAVSLSNFADCRGYATVLAKRIEGRFLATAGRTRETFAEASEKLGGMRLDGPGQAYRFRLLPRVPVTIIRHEGDEEFGPAANFILQRDAERLLEGEDRIVATELLIESLSGKPMEQVE